MKDVGKGRHMEDTRKDRHINNHVYVNSSSDGILGELASAASLQQQHVLGKHSSGVAVARQKWPGVHSSEIAGDWESVEHLVQELLGEPEIRSTNLAVESKPPVKMDGAWLAEFLGVNSVGSQRLRWADF